MAALRPGATTIVERDDAGGRTSWSGIEVRHLAALVAVAREGSFNGAADALGYVQSAVSQQVAHLEQMVGHTLFDRERGARPTLTQAGRLLLAHADEILVRFDGARLDLDRSRHPSANVLRIGTIGVASTHVLAQALSAVRHRYPAVQTSIAEADHGDELLELLRTGALELALVSGGDLEPSFASLSLMSDPTVLVVAADSELDGPPSFDDLRSLDLIRHPTMGDLEPRLRDAGIEPRYTIAAEGSVRILGLVAAGVASAILPRLAVDADDARLVIHPLDRLFEPAVLRLVWMRDRPLSPAASAFADHAQGIVRTVRPRPGTTPTLAVAAA